MRRAALGSAVGAWHQTALFAFLSVAAAVARKSGAFSARCLVRGVLFCCWSSPPSSGRGGYYAFTNREGLRAWFAQLTSGETARPAAPPQAAPPPEVGVLTVQPAEVPLPFEYAGRVAALRDVEVRARVGGLLLRREFEE